MEAHEYIDFYNATSTSGEVIYKIPVQSLRRVSRNKLRGLLTEGLDIKVCKNKQTITLFKIFHSSMRYNAKQKKNLALKGDKKGKQSIHGF